MLTLGKPDGDGNQEEPDRYWLTKMITVLNRPLTSNPNKHQVLASVAVGQTAAHDDRPVSRPAVWAPPASNPPVLNPTPNLAVTYRVKNGIDEISAQVVNEHTQAS